ncbi:hypothetical protein E2C01_003406 [Portunus trituberculatus]|uniref:Uncharacterized protein n=1 Tax=Portunus trituberculatus TaxID=210409 RepID=A0A5B7CQZ4_PORTR|nr:hypothetical protein [Portunus trituberculatus]
MWRSPATACGGHGAHTASGSRNNRPFTKTLPSAPCPLPVPREPLPLSLLEPVGYSTRAAPTAATPIVLSIKRFLLKTASRRSFTHRSLLPQPPPPDAATAHADGALGAVMARSSAYVNASGGDRSGTRFGSNAGGVRKYYWRLHTCVMRVKRDWTATNNEVPSLVSPGVPRAIARSAECSCKSDSKSSSSRSW